MSTPNPKSTPTLQTLIDTAESTQVLISRFQSSLLPAKPTLTSKPNGQPTPTPSPLHALTASTTLLRSHTTTLSLLLLTPPLTPSALIEKMSQVSSKVLSNMVASVAPSSTDADGLSNILRTELGAHVRRILTAWNEVLNLVLGFARRRQMAQKGKMGKEMDTPTETERQDVLAATGVVWEACDALSKICAEGTIGVVVRKAQEYRATLLDAVEELKEWGEDIEDDDEEDGKDGAEGSDGDDDFLNDEDNIFGAANKLPKSDEALRALLETSIKKLKMVSLLYQALVKRRLKTFPSLPPSPSPSSSTATTTSTSGASQSNPTQTLDTLLITLSAISSTVDDLASAFYDLSLNEATQTLESCCNQAKSTVELMSKSWTGTEDEFTAWGKKWMQALDAV